MRFRSPKKDRSSEDAAQFSGTSSELSLKVQEAYTRDVLRGVTRIDHDSMDSLGASIGDVIEIRGKRRTVARCSPLLPPDENKNMLRMDGLIRNNTGTAIGDTVIVKKIKAVPAEKVIVAPLEAIPPIDERYLVDALENVALIKGDNVMTTYHGGRLTFQVIGVAPAADGVVVTNKTIFHIAEKGEFLRAVPSLTYEDIGGLNEEIQKVREVIELPFRHPEIHERLGFNPSKAILIYGPHGVGKTLLGKAIGAESGVHFLSFSGQAIPAIKNPKSGEWEERLGDIFKEAKEKAPSIVFIDDIEEIAPRNEEIKDEVQRRLVRQLLLLTDWIKQDSRVIVVAATGRLDFIDPALRKRFDTEIELKLPDERGRLEILQIHTRSMPLDPDVDQAKIASKTEGFVGSDLEHLCELAAIKAQRRTLPLNLKDEKLSPEVLNKVVVIMKDFEDALSYIKSGKINAATTIVATKASLKDQPDLPRESQPSNERPIDIICPSCRQANATGAKFCSGCGTNIAFICRKCANTNPQGAKFCNQCGSGL